MTGTDVTNPDTPSPPRRPRKRWLRITIIALLIPLALIAVGMFLMRQSWVVIPVVRPILERELGGDVDIGAAKVEGSSAIILRVVTVRSREHAGEAAAVARIGSIRIGANLLGLIFGGKEALEITLADAVLRLSEDESQPGEFSFMALGKKEEDDDDSPSARLALTLLRSQIEVGSHLGPTYTPASRLPIQGTIESAGEREEWFEFQLWETEEGGREVPPNPLQIKGRINIETLAMEGRVDGLVFDDRLAALCPRIVQAWWSTLDPEGAVRDARLEMDGAGGIAASIDVQVVALTIPIEREDVWRRYAGGSDSQPAGMPRMRVASGRLFLREGVLTLDQLQGVLLSSERTANLAEVPYRVHGTIGPLAAEFNWSQREEWLDQLIHAAPINLSFAMEGFHFDGTPGSGKSAVELPAAITRVLEQFSVESCTLDTSITITRTAGARTSDGTYQASNIVTAGRAKLSEGRGAYVKFPYPMIDVSAEMRFDNDQVVVESLLARGPAGGNLSIGGTVWPPTNWPNVDVHISGVDLPVDEHLHAAMPEKYRNVLDAVLHQPSYESLAAAGALPDADDIAAAHAEIERLIQERRLLVESPEAIDAPPANDGAIIPPLTPLEAIDKRIASLQRVVARNGFTFGGSVNIEIDIDRVEGRGQKTYTTGTIEIIKGGMIIDFFPYPFTVEHALLRLERDRAIVDHWTGEAVGGGHVFVNGVVNTPRIDGKTRVQPELEIGLVDDIINPALFAAVPLAGGEDDDDDADVEGGVVEQEPGETAAALERAGGILAAANLEGLIGFQGRVYTNVEGDVEWDFAVAMEDGAAAPDPQGARSMRELGLFWPEGFTLDDVSSVFRVSHEGVRIAALTGRRGEGDVALTGEMSVDDAGVHTSYEIDFDHLALEDYLLNLFSEDATAQARELWDRWNPQGWFDAHLSYGAGEGPAEGVLVQLMPGEISLEIAGERRTVTGTGESAAIVAEAGRVILQNLRLHLGTAEVNDGTLALAGTFGEGADDSLHIAATSGRFESPWMNEAFDLAGSAEQWTEWIAGYQPQGRFDAMAVLSSNGAGDTYLVELFPQTLSVAFNNTPLNLAFEPGGVARIEPGLITLSALAGRFSTGASFDLAGEIDLGDMMDARLVVGYEGDAFDAEGSAFLPSALLDGLRNIEFHTAAPVRFADAQVRLTRMSDDDQEGEAIWRRSFDGDVSLDEAGFVAGVPFTGGRGTVHISAEHQSGLPTRASADIKLEQILARGRMLTDVNATLLLSEEGRAILLPEITATCYGGLATASARAGLGQDDTYDVRVDLFGVNLREFSSAQEDGDPADGGSASDTEGTLFAGLALRGSRLNPDERVGSAHIEVTNGTLASNPITLPLLQLSQLMLPIDASLKYGRASLYIAGDIAVIEEFALEGDRLILAGGGTLTIDGLELDLLLRSRGTLAGLSNVLAALSDQIYAIRVTGPIENTEADIVALPALSEALFGTDSSAGWTQGTRRAPPGSTSKREDEESDDARTADAGSGGSPE